MRTKNSKLILAAAGMTSLAVIAAVANAKSNHYEALTNVDLDMQAAAHRALSTVPGTIIEAELERDDGRYVWEIEMVNEANQLVNIELDGNTGDVLETELEDDLAPNLAGSRSLEEAIALISTIDNAVITKAELELDNGGLVWEFTTIDSSNDKVEHYVTDVSREEI